MHFFNQLLFKKINFPVYIFFFLPHMQIFSQKLNHDNNHFKIELPTPSGKYNIGARNFSAIDASRFDSVLKKKGRDIVFQIWYPSLPKQRKMINYIPEVLIKAMQKDQYNNIDSTEILNWGRLKTHTSENIPLALSKKFPVIFFLHGFGMSRYSYITIIEELVSHGFAVISLESPHSGLMILPDGEVYNTNYDEAPDVKCASMAKDVIFTYDWIKKSNDKKLLPLKNVIDFSQTGVFGHSLGGAAALEVCRIDDRFSACIDLDGDPFGKVEEVGFTKPTLVLLNEPVFTENHFPNPESKKKWQDMGNTRKKMWQDIFLKNESVPAYAFVINGTNHFTFSDFPFVTNKYYQNSRAGIIIDKNKGLKIISKYILDFFSRYILRDNSISINKLTEVFSESTLYLMSDK